MWISCDELFRETMGTCVWKFLFSDRDGYVFSDSKMTDLETKVSWEYNPALRYLVAMRFPEALI